MKTMRVLSIDGGGMRGYIPCAILAQLEKQTGKPCHEMFDLIAGTSIGGIVGALLAAGIPAEDALKFFTESGPEIFKRRWWRYFGLFGPRYSGEAIEAVLRSKLLDAKLKSRLLITSLDLNAQQPYFFKFNPGQYHEEIWKAARATSSAQIFFPAFKTVLADGNHVFWDGGNVANNPALCAYAEAKKLGAEKVSILSLGCGDSYTPLNLSNMINANAIVNGVTTVSMLFEAGSEEVNYIIGQLKDATYYRYQPELPKALPIDGVSPEDIKNLQAVADNCLVDKSLQKILTKFK
jgi:hypothetical protein